MNPTVSVILPTYNRSNKLRRSMNTVLNQTFNDLELIVVDDDSKTDTKSIVNSFDDERIRFFQHSSNKGGSAARNTGIKHSRGTYISFIDDDDLWNENKTKIEYNFIQDNDVIGTYTDFSFEHEYKLAKTVLRFLPEEKDPKISGGSELIPMIISGEISLGGASTLLIKRDIVEEIEGFDDSYDRLQDWEFSVRVLEKGTLGYIDEELVTKKGYNPPSSEIVELSWEKFKKEFYEHVQNAESQGYDVDNQMYYKIGRSRIREGNIIKGMRTIPSSKFLNFKNALSIIFSIYIGMK